MHRIDSPWYVIEQRSWRSTKYIRNKPNCNMEKPERLCMNVLMKTVQRNVFARNSTALTVQQEQYVKMHLLMRHHLSAQIAKMQKCRHIQIQMNVAWKEYVARKIISYNGSGKRERLNVLCFANGNTFWSSSYSCYSSSATIVVPFYGQ